MSAGDRSERIRVRLSVALARARVLGDRGAAEAALGVATKVGLVGEAFEAQLALADLAGAGHGALAAAADAAGYHLVAEQARRGGQL
jgi:hypothetical protein